MSRAKARLPGRAGAPGRKAGRAAPGFALKLTLAMVLVLTLALSLGGAALLAGNFSDSLNEAGQQAEAQHLLQCYALESNLLDVAARGETVTDSHLTRYGSTAADYTGGLLTALFHARDDAPEEDAPAMQAVYTSFPWEETPSGCAARTAGPICCLNRVSACRTARR